jgi:hypothetical protein
MDIEIDAIDITGYCQCCLSRGGLFALVIVRYAYDQDIVIVKIVKLLVFHDPILLRLVSNIAASADTKKGAALAGTPP